MGQLRGNKKKSLRFLPDDVVTVFRRGMWRRPRTSFSSIGFFPSSFFDILLPSFPLGRGCYVGTKAVFSRCVECHRYRFFSRRWPLPCGMICSVGLLFAVNTS